MSVNTVKKWFETQRMRYGKLLQMTSGQTPEKSTRRQNWLITSFTMSPVLPLAATASVPATTRETESEMEISMTSDVTHQPSSTSPSRQPPAVTTTTAADPVLDQLQQVRMMISSLLGAHQDPTPSPRQLFCNYLHSEIEHLE